MSPFYIAVVLILFILFGVLSLTPVISGPKDMYSYDAPIHPKAKGAH